MEEGKVFPEQFDKLIYALTKHAARNSFREFLEEWEITNYEEIREFLHKNDIHPYV
ncbi:hypothetical protein SM938_22545 [Escherichia coli]|nr:hypothetical protein SM938_22545 [Escherichia coli]